MIFYVRKLMVKCHINSIFAEAQDVFFCPVIMPFFHTTHRSWLIIVIEFVHEQMIVFVHSRQISYTEYAHSADIFATTRTINTGSPNDVAHYLFISILTTFRPSCTNKDNSL